MYISSNWLEKYEILRIILFAKNTKTEDPLICILLAISFSVVFQSLGTLSPYSQVRIFPPVRSRALMMGSDKSPGVINMLVLLLLSAHLPGLWQPGYEAEALLQSRLHRLADIQPPRHVTSHPSISTALWLHWSVKDASQNIGHRLGFLPWV